MYKNQFILYDSNAKGTQLTQRKIEIGINIFPVIFKLKTKLYTGMLYLSTMNLWEWNVGMKVQLFLLIEN